MHNKRSVWGVVLVGLIVVAVCTAQAAASTVWPSNSSGSNSRFGWSDGVYDTGHFGSPNVDTAGFHFVNTVNFKAETSGASMATDWIDVRMNVDNATPTPAAPLPTILVREWGRWYGASLTNPGGYTDVAINPSTSLTGIRPEPGITNPVHSFADAAVYNPVDTGLGYGTWYAEYLYTPSLSNPIPERLPWIEVILTVTNELYAVSDGAWIQKDGMDIIIPEPATMVLLLGGFGVAAARRRR